MPIKMIATDLDGTLLHTDKEISEYTLEVFRRCRNEGVKIVFATARPKRVVGHFVQSILPDAVILHNGACVFIGERLFSHCGIQPDTVKNILQSVSRDHPSAILSVEIDDVLYANFDVTKIWNNTGAVMTSSFSDLPDKPAEKIIIGISSMSELDGYSKYLPDELYIQPSEGKIALIMHRSATKFNAVSALAARYGFGTDEIAAFGDDYNDVEMLSHCGAGVAMGNALDVVKAAARYVCDTNDADGVAKWLSKEMGL